MDKQQITAVMLIVGLATLQGCGGGGDSADTLRIAEAGSLAEQESDSKLGAQPGADAEPEPVANDSLIDLTSDDVDSPQDAALSESSSPEIDVTTDGDHLSTSPAEGGTAENADAMRGPAQSDESLIVSMVSTDTIGAANTDAGNPAVSAEVEDQERVNDGLQLQQVPAVPVGAESEAEQADSAQSSEFVDSAKPNAAEDRSVDHNDDPAFTESFGIDTITDLILLTGQSNAASLVTRYDAALDTPDSRVFAFTDQGWQVADLHQFWDEGIPGNFSANDPERSPYNNIIFQVGKALADTADRKVGIVMLTAPGEGISHWDYNGEFYNRMREHALAALNEVPHKSSFDALLWMQGETDWLLQGTADPDLKDSFESYQSDAYIHYYPRKLAELIASLRADPWFGDQAFFICTETIKAALNPHLMWLNNDDDPLTGCAEASDLAARDNDPHGNHFSAESLRVLGKRIADVYLQLLPALKE